MFAIAYDTSLLLALITGAVAIIAVVPHTVLPIEKFRNIKIVCNEISKSYVRKSYVDNCQNRM